MKLALTRQYRQDARAASAAATAERILDAFIALARERWLDEVTLDEVARDAGVTVQTVIRRFGGKDGLLDAAAERMGRQIQAVRETAPGRIAEGIAALLRDYEETGDMVVRLLAQELRYPALRPLMDRGRAWHKEWLEGLFAPFLEPLGQADRERRVAQLVIMTDVYAWQLLRRDQGRSTAEAREIIEEGVRAIASIGKKGRDGA
jgi:AcrR family transcriptional regulator